MNEFRLPTRARFCQLFAWAGLLLAAPASHAEIYKWVDAQGRTHYSEGKEHAGKAKAVELRLSSQPASEKSTTPAPPAYSDSRRSSRRGSSDEPPPRPRSLSGGRSDDTDASRCNLARDVLSGAVRHGNGAPTDAYDRQIAENDVRLFCR